MYAVIELGSTQYRVKEGDLIETNRLEEKEGEDILLDKVLLFENGSDLRVGHPYLEDVKIKAKVLKHSRGEKVVAFKFRRRKNYHRKKGHRQELTQLNITKIVA